MTRFEILNQKTCPVRLTRDHNDPFVFNVDFSCYNVIIKQNLPPVIMSAIIKQLTIRPYALTIDHTVMLLISTLAVMKHFQLCHEYFTQARGLKAEHIGYVIKVWSSVIAVKRIHNSIMNNSIRNRATETNLVLNKAYGAMTASRPNRTAAAMWLMWKLMIMPNKDYYWWER